MIPATTDSITVFIRDSLTIVGLIGYLLYLNWQLTLISLVVAPLVAALIRRINTLFRRYSRRIQNSMGDVTRVAKEAIEAPRIEGCSEFGIFNRIVLPCIMPGVATMCIFNFVASWNAYMGPLIILQRKELYTMPVMISMIKGLYVTNYGAMYLAVAISVIPIMIVFAIFSRYIIDGLTAGSEK